VIRQVEAQRQTLLDHLAEDREYCEMTLKKQLNLLKQDLECKIEESDAPMVPVVSTEGIEFQCSDEVFCFGHLKRQRGTFRPHSVSFDRNASYVDPCTLSGDLYFEVHNLNGVSVISLEKALQLIILKEKCCTKVVCLDQMCTDHTHMSQNCSQRVIMWLKSMIFLKHSSESGDQKEKGLGSFWGCSVFEEKVYVADYKGNCAQVFDLEGTFLQSIAIQCPRFIVIVEDTVWVVRLHFKLTILSKEGAILAEDVETVRIHEFY
jgi:hypothetical protein